MSGADALREARRAIGWDDTSKGVKLLDQARREFHHVGDVEGLLEVLELATELPPKEHSAFGIGRDDVLYATRENIREVTRKAALRANRPWHDPDGAPAPAAPPTRMTRRELAVSATITASLLAVGAAVVVGTRLPQRISHWSRCNKGFEGAPAASPDGRRIVFARKGSCDTELYVIRSDGTHLRRLPGTRVGDELPAWSPDGRTLAFAGPHGVYTMRFDGTGRRKIFPHGSVLGVAWSPDGRRLAFTRTTGTDLDLHASLYTMNSDGSDLRPVVAHGIEPVTATWSPDGRRLAVAGMDGIYALDANGTGLDRIVKEESVDVSMNAAWSPDGRTLAYDDQYGLRLVDVASHRRLRTIGDSSGGYGVTVSWPRQGGEIVYSATPFEGPGAIYTIHPDGTRQRLLTTY